MISFLISLFFREEIKKSNFKMYLFYEIINLFLTVSLLYFAGKALAFSSQQNNDSQSNYLHFLFYGEIALILPLGFGDKVISQYTLLRSNGFFQTILSLGHNPLSFLIKKSFVESYILILRLVLMIFLGEFVLNIGLTFSKMMYFLVPQLIGTLLFTYIAFQFILFHWEFNRGLKFFYSLQTIFSIFSGQFFPREVLPFEISGLLKYFPHSLILDQSRSNTFSFTSLLILIAWTILLGLCYRLSQKATTYRLKSKSVYFSS